MGTALIEVLKDLWNFATRQSGAVSSTKQLPAPTLDTPVSKVQSPAKASLESRICYVRTAQLACLQMPQKQFDTVRADLHYGDALRVVHQKHHWSFVEHQLVQGWVETQYLTEDPAEVLPDLQNNQFYGANDPQTLRLRQYLDVQTLAAELALCVQSAEYIFYRLKKAGQQVSWPLERPRSAGRWCSILEGKTGVQIGSAPRTHSVLEGSDAAGQPFLAYVETVTPEQVITLSAVGEIDAGVFTTNTYTRAQWQAFTPSFISFT